MFQVFYTIADEDHCKHQLTTEMAGYSANSVQDTVHNKLLVNLLTANNIDDNNTITDPLPPSTGATVNAITLEAVKTMMEEILASSTATNTRTRNRTNC